MSRRAWGVNEDNIIARIWENAPPGDDGDVKGGYTMRFPQSGESVRDFDVGKRFDGLRPAGVIYSGAQRADNAFRSWRRQAFAWIDELYHYGPVIYRSGHAYLVSADQANLIVLGDATTYPDTLATTIFTNAAMGAADIDSVAAFVASAYAGRSNPAPTRALLWINKTTGARVNLDSMVDYGALVEQQPFSEPAAWRAA